jgi:hypothetical protein
VRGLEQWLSAVNVLQNTASAPVAAGWCRPHRTVATDGKWLAPRDFLLAAGPAGGHPDRDLACLAVSRAATQRTLARMYYETIRQMHKMLGQLDTWLETAATHAESQDSDPNLFLGMRLAPDQFPFLRQVQTACDTAKLAAGRLAGKPPRSPIASKRSMSCGRASGRC